MVEAVLEIFHLLVEISARLVQLVAEVLQFEVIEIQRVAEMRQHLQRLFSGYDADVGRNLSHLRRLDALLDDAVDIEGLDRVVHLRHVEVVVADAREELVRLRDHSGVANHVFTLSVAEPEQRLVAFLHLADAGDVRPGAVGRISIATGQQDEVEICAALAAFLPGVALDRLVGRRRIDRGRLRLRRCRDSLGGKSDALRIR